MKEMTVKELKKMRDENSAFQLIDVREPHEVEIAEIGGELIPMGDVLANMDKIKRDIPVIVHCRSGARSASIILALEKQFGFTNLYNHKGGILAWAKEIDSSIATY